MRGPGSRALASASKRKLDDNGAEVPDGTPGELYSRTPYTFDAYWNQPEKTRDAFRGDYCSVGDMALRDADGCICLIDARRT